MTAQSGSIQAQDYFNQDRFNELRNDILSINVGHSHSGTVDDGKRINYNAVIGTPEKSFFQSSNVVYRGQAPYNFTTLNLSSVVGSRQALTFLRVEDYNEGDYSSHPVMFRPAGDGTISGSAGANSCQADGLQASYVWCQTNTNGAVEWRHPAQNYLMVAVAAYFI